MSEIMPVDVELREVIAERDEIRAVSQREIALLGEHLDRITAERDTAVAALGVAEAALAQARAENDEWSEWSNSLAESMPESYDGDEAQEGLIERCLTDGIAAMAALAREGQCAKLEVLDRAKPETRYGQFSMPDPYAPVSEQPKEQQ